MRVHARLAAGILAIAVLLAPVAALPAEAFGSGGSYSHPYPEGVQVGDIVFGHGKLDWLIPGYWTHVGMIAYWDPQVGDWIVVESDLSGGVHLSTLSEFLARYDTVAIAHVAAPESVRQAAVEFALEQLGKGYDLYWFTKQVYGSSYYCSELVWAAYKAVGGPDLDENPGWSWTYAYGVAPQEVYDDSDTIVYYYDSAS